jgi:hypothetical protein
VVYNLRIWAAGHGPGVEISAAEYTALVRALERIYLATGLEEKLDLLLENYLEYERELLHLALQSCLFTSIDNHRVFREVQLIDRRVINLLTAARMYVDQVKHSVSRYFDPGSAPDVSALFSAEYERYLEYRIAEALRNHAQHRALPVHQLSWPSGWEEMNALQQRLRFCVIPSILVEELVNEGEFKPSVLAELQKTGKESFPLTPILRQYVECLASVHAAVRQCLSSQAELDYQTLMVALERARVELREQLVGLVVSAGEDPERPQEHHHVSDRSWTRRQTLIKKNSNLSNLSRRYVSAEHAGDAAT